MDEQTAFASQYPAYSFDLDMMKRSMEAAAGGPDAKKARWSPTFGQNSSSSSNTSPRDAFANYGYGPQASIQQSQFNTSPSNAFQTSPLYSTPPTLTVNTQQTSPALSQMSPNTAAAFSQQQQQQTGQQAQASPNGYGNFGSYNMISMGMPGMNMLGGFPYSGFAQQRLPSLQIPAGSQSGPQSAYSPIAFSPAAAMGGGNAVTGRTVYVGNLPATASVDELLNLVHFGPLESIRVLPEKSCVFLSFLDGSVAAAFHADATIKKLSLHGQELKIGWGKPSPVPAQVALAIQQSNASRNVYLGGLDEGVTEEQLRDDLSRFGLIDQVKIVRDKNIGFVHFLSITVAIKVVNTLPSEPAWAGKRVSFGKDRCAYIPKSQQAAAQQAQAAAAQSLVAQSAAAAAAAAAAASPQSTHPNSNGGGGAANGVPFSPYAPFSPADALQQAMVMGGGMGIAGANSAIGIQGMNRTVYLGNIHPETTAEELCNAIRGGVLQSIRYMQDKHIAFVTFVDPAAAFTFYQVASYQGMTLNNRRLKIGWGKNSGPLPPTLALAVHSGATRNVYIGNVEDFDVFTEERLKRDFGEYGDVELVNFLKEKNCAFVNFTNISNAIKAIEGIKTKPEYANLRIAYGKDRCANPPRSGPQGGSGGRRNASGAGHHVSNGNGNAMGAEDGVKLEDGADEGVATGLVAEESEQKMHVDDSLGVPASVAAAGVAA
ncbi:differentiation regulator [Moniliophthora roreri]|nr:differentiation regulator [Moniliophthora roreri]